VLLGCAWTLAAAAAAPVWAADSPIADRPILLAQARVPVLAQTQPPRQQPRLISLDFKDADINNILRILAEFSGLNIVTSDDVKGKVTVKLQNVPWQQALDSVVRAAKLGYVQEGNIIRVDRLENLTKEAEAQFKAEQREVEIQQRRKEAEIRIAEQERAKKRAEAREEIESAPLVEAIIPLKYAHVGVRRVQVINFLNDSISTEERRGVEEAIIGGRQKEEGKPAGLLSGRGQLTIDQRTNSLIVRDIPPYVEKIREFIVRLDRPTAAVQIEARVVEINRDDARRLGVIWGGAFTPRAGANSPIVDVRGGAGPRVTGEGIPPSSTVANFPAPPVTSPFNAGNLFGLTLGWVASNLALDLSLQALEGESRARIISSPSLMTLENEPATFASGRREPIISLTVVQGATQASVAYADVTTRMQVVPRVAAEDGRLVLTIGVKRDTFLGRVDAPSLSAPIIGTKQAITQVRIPDGGTVVLAGLREDNSTNRQEGLPWVRNIPVLGWLFKNDQADANRAETMVFLTAKVVENPGEAAVSPSELPAAPGAPAPPGKTGQAPASPVAPLTAVSSAAPAPEAPRVDRPAPSARTDEITR
jgi:type IV pilus assembly protein PilQ